MENEDFPGNGRVRYEAYASWYRHCEKRLPFQVHYVDEETGEIVNKPVKRATFLEYFVNRAPCLIGMEACGGAHHWARRLAKIGHEVKLMPAEFVKAFNIRNKNDSADARAIWLGVQQPSKAVAVKTEMRQSMLALHRMREQLVNFRTMQIHALRGLLTEYGEVMGKGRAVINNTMPGVLARVAERLPAALIDNTSRTVERACESGQADC